ncbi:hypothetical protein [Alkalimonas mucilaginosa]|uniref:Uncharacterized protein n=1 Tax=Alkalimonas mucilaginosa TaxID=3057676 RepID=A0ABU7JGS8_9GAMM|nr:hypothetical protein [Alkalimonas sp. MEB004]MEE2024881.1 hypothetical protein [Alkalimonas sp. MEB004]
MAKLLLLSPTLCWQQRLPELSPYSVFVLFDTHCDAAGLKGVFFDTHRSLAEYATWSMIEHSRVIAFGDAKRLVEYLTPSDVVFFCHKWCGLVAAARVKKGPVQAPDTNTLYRDVEFLTPIPTRDSVLQAMPFGKDDELSGKRFFLAKTIKVPYLSRAEAELILSELCSYLEGGILSLERLQPNNQ